MHLVCPVVRITGHFGTMTSSSQRAKRLTCSSLKLARVLARYLLSCTGWFATRESAKGV